MFQKYMMRLNVALTGEPGSGESQRPQGAS